MADFDFDNLLGDLNSAIADLETISVVSVCLCTHTHGCVCVFVCEKVRM